MLRAVVEQHAEDAAFLWSERCASVGAPHVRLEDLVRIDARIEANLDGLRAAGHAGARLASRAVRHGDAGEAFVAAFLAIESNDTAMLSETIEAAPDFERGTGVAGAIAWVSAKRAAAAIAHLRAAHSPTARFAALVGAVAHDLDPGTLLDAALLARDPIPRKAALAAIGDLRRADRRGAIFAGLLSDERACRHAAARSAVILGHAAGIDVLMAIAERGAALAEESAVLAVLSLPPAEAAKWVASLSRAPGLRRSAICAAGALGDPALLPMLVEAMTAPELARVAAHAIEAMTGTPIEGELRSPPPEGFSAGPTDDPGDEDVAPDPDDGLAWPHVAAVREALDRRAPELATGKRYLLGRPLDRRVLREALRHGTMDVRALAAFELALSGGRVFDVAAPSHRQLRALTALDAGPEA